MSLRLTVQFKIKEGASAAFEAAIGEATTQVKAEDAGCEMYDLFKSVDDDTRYALIESWASQEDIDAHAKSPGMAKMMGIGPHLDGRPLMHRYADE
jgi:quinol monooxygenase YgiN